MHAIKGSLIFGSNKLSGSSLNSRHQEPHKISYPQGWRKGETEKWYKSQPTTRFTHLEYRKERDGPFYHEFVVVELDNSTLCRFDRRGDVNTRAHAFTAEGITAEDTAHVIEKGGLFLDQIGNTDLLLRIHFPQGLDILGILAICYGVQHDEHARAYTLLRYNCYFLSWTIVTATARRTVDWAIVVTDTGKWENLVKTTINGLTPDPSRLDRFRATTRAALGMAPPGSQPAPILQSNPVPFIGSTYLISTLRKALVATRPTVQQTLSELILRSTIHKSLHDTTEKYVREAAIKAAQNYASQAARDTAMEAVVESMWRSILAVENAGQIWEERCRATEQCVWRTAAAAAAVAAVHQPITPPATPPPDPASPLPPTPAAEGPEVPPPKAKWEEEWDTAWAENWADLTGTARGRSNSTASRGSEATGLSISQRTKAAWEKAWIDASRANDEYVPRISQGVADYVMSHLPEALPELLKIDMTVQPSKVKAVVKAFTSPDSSIAKLQEWIQERISDHCQRVASLTVGATPPNKGEIEEAMRRVWVATIVLAY